MSGTILDCHGKKKEIPKRPGTTKGRKEATNSKKSTKVLPNSVRPTQTQSVVKPNDVPNLTRKPSSAKPAPRTADDNSSTTYYRRLFDAIYHNDANAVKYMITTEKLDVNIVDEDDPLRPTPLLVVCEQQLVDIARELFKGKPKPDVNKGNKRGRRPIWYVYPIININN